jgi:heterotetrameric sarcosine oxidase gamma subunit
MAKILPLLSLPNSLISTLREAGCVAETTEPLSVAAGAVARSPVRQAPPLKRVGDWEVSGRRSQASLRLTDLSPLAKVAVRVGSSVTVGQGPSVGFGRAQRDDAGNLVIGAAPGEWLVLGRSGRQHVVQGQFESIGRESFTTVIDLTHAYALVRLTGDQARSVLSKLCPVDLSARTAPNGTALRTAVAGLALGVVRDDTGDQTSFLCYCERSSGQYLFDVLLDAGAEFAVDVDGYPDDEI